MSTHSRGLDDRQHLVKTPRHGTGQSTPSHSRSPTPNVPGFHPTSPDGGTSSASAAARARESIGRNEVAIRHVVNQIGGVLEDLRSKYRLERKELVTTIGDQIRDVKMEALSLRSAQMDSERKVDSMRKRVEAMENAAVTQVPASDLLGATEEKVANLHTILTKSSEEVELLKQALLSDRMLHEQRQQAADIEDGHLEERLREIEKSTEDLGSELLSTREATIAATSAAEELVTSIRADAPLALEAHNISASFQHVLEDLHEVRRTNAEMAARIESIAAFSEQEEKKRNQHVERIESVLHDLEATSARKPTHDSSWRSTDEPPYPRGRERSTSNSHRRADDRDNNNSANAAAVSANRPPTPPPVHNAHSFLNETRRIAQNQPPHVSWNDLAHSSPSLPATHASMHGPQTNADYPHILTVRQMVAEFYSIHNPEKLSSLDIILEEYYGADEELMSALEAQYGAFGFFEDLICRHQGLSPY